jgi:hypothetical protein
VRSLASVLALSVLVAGCGGGENGKPKPISGAAKQVAQVIERLETATAKRDFQSICDELLAAATRRQAGGAECPAVLAARARGVRRPRIVIRQIAVQGSQAVARVTTTAIGQAPATDTIRLVREGGSFRIASLGR